MRRRQAIAKSGRQCRSIRGGRLHAGRQLKLPGLLEGLARYRSLEQLLRRRRMQLMLLLRPWLLAWPGGLQLRHRLLNGEERLLHGLLELQGAGEDRQT